MLTRCEQKAITRRALWKRPGESLDEAEQAAKVLYDRTGEEYSGEWAEMDRKDRARTSPDSIGDWLQKVVDRISGIPRCAANDTAPTGEFFCRCPEHVAERNAERGTSQAQRHQWSHWSGFFPVNANYYEHRMCLRCHHEQVRYVCLPSVWD
jgi:hypothetical protein